VCTTLYFRFSISDHVSSCCDLASDVLCNNTLFKLIEQERALCHCMLRETAAHSSHCVERCVYLQQVKQSYLLWNKAILDLHYKKMLTGFSSLKQRFALTLSSVAEIQNDLGVWQAVLTTHFIYFQTHVSSREDHGNSSPRGLKISITGLSKLCWFCWLYTKAGPSQVGGAITLWSLVGLWVLIDGSIKFSTPMPCRLIFLKWFAHAVQFMTRLFCIAECSLTKLEHLYYVLYKFNGLAAWHPTFNNWVWWQIKPTPAKVDCVRSPTNQ